MKSKKKSVVIDENLNDLVEYASTFYQGNTTAFVNHVLKAYFENASEKFLDGYHIHQELKANIDMQ